MEDVPHQTDCAAKWQLEELEPSLSGQVGYIWQRLHPG